MKNQAEQKISVPEVEHKKGHIDIRYSTAVIIMFDEDIKMLVDYRFFHSCYKQWSN
jgi:hypothetical protein